MTSAPAAPILKSGHLLGIEGLLPDEVTALLDLADSYVVQGRAADKKTALLKGRTLINLFYEASTRTQSSFELAGKRLGDLVDAESRATAQTLFKNGRPVRTVHLPKVDEFGLGALMMHFMLETIIMGKLMGVDPFNQPGVEEGKILARQYLAEG